MNDHKTVRRSQLAAWVMVEGGEDMYPVVIDGNHVWKWVAIGWIDCGPASEEDLSLYPHVKED
jgi:hypothetical protein